MSREERARDARQALAERDGIFELNSGEKGQTKATGSVGEGRRRVPREEEKVVPVLGQYSDLGERLEERRGRVTIGGKKGRHKTCSIQIGKREGGEREKGRGETDM